MIRCYLIRLVAGLAIVILQSCWMYLKLGGEEGVGDLKRLSSAVCTFLLRITKLVICAALAGMLIQLSKHHLLRGGPLDILGGG